MGSLHNKYFQAVFILVIYLIYDMSFTVQDLSMWGMTSVMSPKSEERSRLAQWGRIGASIGSWIPGLIPVFISVSEKLNISQTVLFAFLGIFVGLGGMLISITSSTAKERVLSVPEKGSSLIKDDFALLFKNKTVMMILLGSILGGLSLTVPQIYFFKYKVAIDIFGFQMDGVAFSFIYGILAGLPGMLAMFIAPYLAKKVGGMKNILILSYIFAIISRLLCFAIGYEGNKILLITLIMALGGIPAGITGIAMTSLFGDSIDYMEYKTGKRGEAITFAAQVFSNKIGVALSTAITAALLTAMNYSAAAYDSGAALSAEFDKWIWPLFILGPIIGSALNLIPILFIKYPNSLKAKVEEELKVRREKAQNTEAVENTVE